MLISPSTEQYHIVKCPKLTIMSCHNKYYRTLAVDSGARGRKERCIGRQEGEGESGFGGYPFTVSTNPVQHTKG